jgi:hypothetical protein
MGERQEEIQVRRMEMRELGLKIGRIRDGKVILKKEGK